MRILKYKYNSGYQVKVKNLLRSYLLRKLYAPAVTLFSIILLCSGCGDEFGILLDDPHTDPGIYWTENNKTINYVKKDKTGKKTLLTGSGIPLDIEIYPPGRKIYWTEYTGSAFQIWNASTDGSSKTLFYQPTGSDFGPTAIAVDPLTGLVYWNEYSVSSGHNDVWRSPAYAPEKWVKTITPFYTLDMCIDTINNRIYITANNYWDIYTTSSIFFGSGNSGVICNGNLIDGSYSLPVNGTGPTDPSISLRGIAADGTAGYVYYANNDSSYNQTIRRALSANLADSEEWISAGSYAIRKIALDLKERKIYWTSGSGTSIWRADIDTANSNIELFLSLDSIPTGIAIVP
ncbi:MAG TPA: hypothetical protein PK514_06650 [Spirochaetota bacterium]|nr:hypothetical protein [Spirochaetota bacterium]